MASLINHPRLINLQGILYNNLPLYLSKRGTAVPPRRKPKPGTIKHRNLIKSTEESLAARGFLRSHKPYNPPEDAASRVQTLVANSLGAKDQNYSMTCDEKFTLLNACFKEFNHSVPNSLLHKILTLQDVVNFYMTEVNTTTPLDEFKRRDDLPPNLHIQYDYVRFHPDTDTMFDGVSAYNESSTVVTGLKYKDKYKGHKQKPPAYMDAWSDYIKHNQYKP